MAGAYILPLTALTIAATSWTCTPCKAQSATSTVPDAKVRLGEGTPLSLDWKRLPDLPNAIGVAGPFVGVHGDVLIVAGGANFAPPVWESSKSWTDQVWVLGKSDHGTAWISGRADLRPIAYGAAASTMLGVVCMGGNDSQIVYRDVFALKWNSAQGEVSRIELPRLPKPLTNGQAAVIGDVIYLVGGQSGMQLDSAMNQLWSLDLSKQEQSEEFAWRELPALPSLARAFNITTQQHNGEQDCIYVIGGRCMENGSPRFLNDVWEFNPVTQHWLRRADAPRAISAGVGIGFGANQILVLGGDDGALFNQTDQLRDRHPGFHRNAYCYNAKTDTWQSAGELPQNQVTTIPVRWNDRIVIASGEVRPRVRTPAVWSIGLGPSEAAK